MLTLIETWECRAGVEELEVDTILWCAYLKQGKRKLGESCYQCPDDANKHARSPVQQDPFSA